MRKIPLSEYAKKRGQLNTAKDLNVTQAAIHKALKADRNIHVFLDRKGIAVRGEETRPFPHQK